MTLRLMVIAVLFLWSVGASAQADVGPYNLKICRSARTVTTWDKKPIDIPAGSEFVQKETTRLGDAPKLGSRVKVIEPLTLPPKPACVTARAAITVRSKMLPDIKVGETLHPGFALGDSADLEAQVIAEN